MVAVLLCAGFATRMYPLGADFPKPLLPVADRPVIDYLVDQIVRLNGIGTIHLVTNGLFAGHFDRWRRSRLTRPDSKHLEIVVHNDGAVSVEKRLGACVDLQLVFRRAQMAGPALVSAGDNIYLFDLRGLWRRFMSGKDHRIVALAENNSQNLKRSGVPVFGAGQRVRRLLEKPTRPPSNWICPPLYFLQPSARDVLDQLLETLGPVDEPGYFIDFLCRKETVSAFKLEARRLDIGHPEAYQAADRLMRSMPWEIESPAGD